MCGAPDPREEGPTVLYQCGRFQKVTGDPEPDPHTGVGRSRRAG